MKSLELKCIRHGETFTIEQTIKKNILTCPNLKNGEEGYATLYFNYPYEKIREEGKFTPQTFPKIYSLLKYKPLLPIEDDSKFLGPKAGWTDLVYAKNLRDRLDIPIHLYIKLEGNNPTGSFKDRGMQVATSLVDEMGFKSVICASTGNTAASLAAYSAPHKMDCLVILPGGAVAKGKIIQAFAFGARIIQIKNNFDASLNLAVNVVEKFGKKYGIQLLNSLNPLRTDGQKTAAYEIYEQLGHRPPDIHILPVGNAANITMNGFGWNDLFNLGLIEKKPRMIGVQAEGASPIYDLIKNKRDCLQPVTNPKTIATAIRIGKPLSWMGAKHVIKNSNGSMEIVSDKEISETQLLLARSEGIFAEPSSCAPIAAIPKLYKNNLIKPDDCIVCTATGSGLKDPDIIDEWEKFGHVIEPKKVSSIREIENLLS
jgi:threonine synthase